MSYIHECKKDLVLEAQNNKHPENACKVFYKCKTDWYQIQMMITLGILDVAQKDDSQTDKGQHQLCHFDSWEK